MWKTLHQKVQIARSTPPEILASTFTNMVKLRISRYVVKIYPVKLSDKDFLKVVGCKTMNGFIDREPPLFFFNPRDKDKIIDTIKEEYPEAIKEIIKDADEICEHVFDLLGSGKTKLGKEIDWQNDFKTNIRWDEKECYIRNPKLENLNDRSDGKVPLELSRFQHFVTLGKAYRYTKNEKYANEFIEQIKDWMGKNPVKLGINWSITMDVAIRTVNWIWGYYFFCDSPSLLKEFKLKFFKSLFLHGRHILNNLEFGLVRGNHYLSDIAGLTYLGIFFQDTQEGQKWLGKGLNALKEEMEVQVYPDGVNCEGSISYHRLVTELFLSSTFLCIKNGITFPEWYMNRLEKMIEFVMCYTKPDGTAPQIGDNDDGRLHILSNYGNWNRLDHRYLLSVGAVVFKRADFKDAADEFPEEAFWLVGVEGLNMF
ncbi:hypothetical protein C4E24_02400 [ANME-1 cluster archaeon AG-394-G21]|nr:hypothetical protein [ANME-1 cluster archaeon AG-394-G21]